MARVVLVAHGPAEAEGDCPQPGEGTLEVGVNPPAAAFHRLGVECLARGEQPLTL